MKGMTPIIAVIVTAGLLMAALIYWQNHRSGRMELRTDTDETVEGPLVPAEQKVKNPSDINKMNPTAIIKTNLGTIEMELFESEMPITVGNFIKLSESGFYNNTKFHRVIDGFMIQGGDPNSKGTNEDTYGTGGSDNIQDEFVSGDLLTNTRGTIAMANTGQPNSGSSQFFINLVDNTGLDFDKPPFTSKHPVFGRVVGGMEVVDEIGKVETKERDIPVDPVVIESITIMRK